GAIPANKAVTRLLVERNTAAFCLLGANLYPILVRERLMPDKATPLPIWIRTSKGMVNACASGNVVKVHPRIQNKYIGAAMPRIVLLLYWSEYLPHTLIEKI